MSSLVTLLEMESFTGCVVWALMLFCAWLWNFSYGFLFTFVTLPMWLEKSIALVMSLASGAATLSFVVFLCESKTRNRWALIIPAIIWLVPAGAGALAIAIH